MRDNLLKKCLDSIKNNVCMPYNMIIINSGEHPLKIEEDLLKPWGRRIEVINNPKLSGLAAKRERFAEIVETEYMMILDNDLLVLANSVENQVKALDQNPHLVACSGLRFCEGRYHSTVADLDIKQSKLIKRAYSYQYMMASEGDLFEADFVPMGHTTYRMRFISKIHFDPAYEIGYGHSDTFLQFYFHHWRSAVHKGSIFTDLGYLSSDEYKKLRHKRAIIKKSRQHFENKWGLKRIVKKMIKQSIPKRPWEIWKNKGYPADCLRRWGPPDKPDEWEKVRRELLKNVPPLIMGSTVLDVGCGLGHLYYLLKGKVEDYLGVDFPTMIHLARKFFPEANFQPGDMYDLSSFSTYDTVCSVSVFKHLPDLNPLRELWKHAAKCVLFTLDSLRRKTILKTREDGLISRRYTKEELDKAIKGLNDIETVEMFKHTVQVEPRKIVKWYIRLVKT